MPDHSGIDEVPASGRAQTLFLAVAPARHSRAVVSRYGKVRGGNERTSLNCIRFGLFSGSVVRATHWVYYTPLPGKSPSRRASCTTGEHGTEARPGQAPSRRHENGRRTSRRYDRHGNCGRRGHGLPVAAREAATLLAVSDPAIIRPAASERPLAVGNSPCRRFSYHGPHASISQAADQDRCLR